MDCFEISQILQLLQAAWDEDRRDWLLLAVTFLYALRASEAVALKKVNIVEDYLVLKRGKGSKPVRMKILEHKNPLLNVGPALFAFSRKAKTKQRLFPICARTFQRKVHRYGRLAGLPDLLCHPHSLKHSILSHLAQTMSLQELQQFSGHKSLTNLGIYLHPKAEVVAEKYRAALDV